MVMGSFGGRPGAALMVIASAHVKPGNEENQIRLFLCWEMTLERILSLFKLTCNLSLWKFLAVRLKCRIMQSITDLVCSAGLIHKTKERLGNSRDVRPVFTNQPSSPHILALE